jgi:streptomycin 6-kinase
LNKLCPPPPPPPQPPPLSAKSQQFSALFFKSEEWGQSSLDVDSVPEVELTESFSSPLHLQLLCNNIIHFLTLFPLLLLFKDFQTAHIKKNR